MADETPDEKQKSSWFRQKANLKKLSKKQEDDTEKKDNRPYNIRVAQDYADPTATNPNGKKMSLAQRFQGLAYSGIEQATLGNLGTFGTIIQQKREGYSSGGFRASTMQVIQNQVFGNLGVFGLALNAHLNNFAPPEKPKKESTITAENLVSVVRVIDEKLVNHITKMQNSLSGLAQAFSKNSDLANKQFEKISKQYDSFVTMDIFDKRFDDMATKTNTIESTLSKLKFDTEAQFEYLIKKSSDNENEYSTAYTAKHKNKNLLGDASRMAGNKVLDGIAGWAKNLSWAELAGGTSIASIAARIGVGIGGALMAPEVLAAIAAVTVTAGLFMLLKKSLGFNNNVDAKDKPNPDVKKQSYEKETSNPDIKKIVFADENNKIDIKVSTFDIKAKSYVCIQADKVIELKAETIILDSKKLIIKTDKIETPGQSASQGQDKVQNASYGGEQLNPGDAVNSNDPGSNPYAKGSGTGSVASGRGGQGGSGGDTVTRVAGEDLLAPGRDKGEFGPNSSAGSFIAQAGMKMSVDDTFESLSAKGDKPKGIEGVLASRREKYFKELDDDPKFAGFVRSAIEHENGGHPEGILEAAMNRADMNGTTLRKQMHSGFFGPINRGEVGSLAPSKKYDDAFDRVRKGSNDIGLRTDQGLPNEHKPAERAGLGDSIANIRGEHYSVMGKEGLDWKNSILKEAANGQSAAGDAKASFNDAKQYTGQYAGDSQDNQRVKISGDPNSVNIRNTVGADVDKVDPRLKHVVSEAARIFESEHPGYKVQMLGEHSGVRYNGSTANHGIGPDGYGRAMDMAIVDPSGKVMADRGGKDGSGEVFPLYAELHKNAKIAQEKFYPGMALGSGFAFDTSAGSGQKDWQHIDISHKNYDWTQPFESGIRGVPDIAGLTNKDIKQRMSEIYDKPMATRVDGKPTSMPGIALGEAPPGIDNPQMVNRPDAITADASTIPDNPRYPGTSIGLPGSSSAALSPEEESKLQYRQPNERIRSREDGDYGRDDEESSERKIDPPHHDPEKEDKSNEGNGSPGKEIPS